MKAKQRLEQLGWNVEYVNFTDTNEFIAIRRNHISLNYSYKLKDFELYGRGRIDLTELQLILDYINEQN